MAIFRMVPELFRIPVGYLDIGIWGISLITFFLLWIPSETSQKIDATVVMVLTEKNRTFGTCSGCPQDVPEVPEVPIVGDNHVFTRNISFDISKNTAATRLDQWNYNKNILDI